MGSINITAAPVEKVEVTLVGKDYQITPPKWALAMKMAVQAKTTGKDDPTVMINTLYEWLDKAFSPADAKAVRKRLDDPKDPIDIPHIMELMEAVMDAQGGENPPT